MRPIKFRAWDKIERKMWVPIIDQDGTPCAQHPISMHLVRMDGELLDPIMQFTGLLDKHGNEIYESDLIVVQDYPFYSKGLRNYVGEIFWDDTNYQWAYDLHVVSDRVSGCACGSGLYDIVGLEIEIIGNIYENPLKDER